MNQPSPNWNSKKAIHHSKTNTEVGVSLLISWTSRFLWTRPLITVKFEAFTGKLNNPFYVHDILNRLWPSQLYDKFASLQNTFLWTHSISAHVCPWGWVPWGPLGHIACWDDHWTNIADLLPPDGGDSSWEFQWRGWRIRHHFIFFKLNFFPYGKIPFRSLALDSPASAFTAFPWVRMDRPTGSCLRSCWVLGSFLRVEKWGPNRPTPQKLRMLYEFVFMWTYQVSVLSMLSKDF